MVNGALSHDLGTEWLTFRFSRRAMACGSFRSTERRAAQAGKRCGIVRFTLMALAILKQLSEAEGAG